MKLVIKEIDYKHSFNANKGISNYITLSLWHLINFKCSDQIHDQVIIQVKNNIKEQLNEQTPRT